MTEDNNRDYTNGEIIVSWKPKECIHATTCFKELRSVFDPGKRPWVNMKGASTDEIIRIVDLCPTNALTYKYNKQAKLMSESISIQDKENNKLITEVRVMRDGPLVVRGEFKLTGADGVELKKMKIVSICRCGQSNNMPYCDGTHRKIRWASD